MNGAHADIILDRIAAGELYPSADLLRCLKGTPASASRLAAIGVETARSKARQGKKPTETERLARIEPLLKREATRREALRLMAEGKEEDADRLMTKFLQAVEETANRRKRGFGA